MGTGEGTGLDPSPEGLEATETWKKESREACLCRIALWP